MHGKTSSCRIDTQSSLFAGLSESEQVGRYHSLAAVEETLPECLRVTARTDDGEIMAVEHRILPIYGIQFHPESILTPHGGRILGNFVEISKKERQEVHR
jgi:anthranilate/para-aminobenzoate synthase component II